MFLVYALSTGVNHVKITWAWAQLFWGRIEIAT